MSFLLLVFFIVAASAGVFALAIYLAARPYLGTFEPEARKAADRKPDKQARLRRARQTSL